MGTMVPNRKKGDIFEANVKDIRFVDDQKESKISRKTKKKYGYEPSELNAETRKSVVRGLKGDRATYPSACGKGKRFE